MSALLHEYVVVNDRGFQVSRYTFGIIQAASWDAANRAMKAGNRTIWSEEDWNTAVREFDRLVAALKAMEEPCAL